LKREESYKTEALELKRNLTEKNDEILKMKAKIANLENMLIMEHL